MLRALDRDKWEPYCACPPGTPLSERLTKDGIPLRPLSLGPWRKWYSPLIRGRDVRNLRALVEQLAPSLVHVNDIWWVPHTIGAVSGVAGWQRPVVAHVRQEIEPEKVKRYSLESA